MKFWGREAAGTLVVACSTKRMLLALRSEYVNEPLTWGLPGGKMERGETPAQAAVRELQEEVGYEGELILVPSFIYKEKSFTFYNFIALVPGEFEVELNEENDEARWVTWRELPKPLHFGADALLAVAREQVTDVLNGCGGMFR